MNRESGWAANGKNSKRYRHFYLDTTLIGLSKTAIFVLGIRSKRHPQVSGKNMVKIQPSNIQGG